jgi:cbb3-type cytochrome c oxidase subunit III
VFSCPVSGPPERVRLARVPAPLNGRYVVAALAVVAAVAAAGCGSAGTGGLSTGGDPEQGKALFKEKCGGCHTLAAAGTNGQVGPNLDAAFGPDRKQGFENSSIQQVVAGQIKFPTTQPSTGAPGMPANLVTGGDVDNVAAFVAKCAGNTDDESCAPPGGGEATSGKDIFSQNCSTCHTLAAAGSTGQVGPNLDQAKPPKALVVDRVTNGKGGMPAFGKNGNLTPQQIQAVADYVASSAGK